MKSRNRISVPLATIAALLLVGAACDNGSSGTSGTLDLITAPTTPITDLTGHWALYAALESASGCGCVGVKLAGTAHTDDGWKSFGEFEWEIAQNGQMILGSYDDNGRCDFMGSFDTTSFSATVFECETMDRNEVCANGKSRTLVLDSSTLQGAPSVEDGVQRIQGTWTETWSCFDSLSGRALEGLNLQYTFELNR